MVSVCCFSVGQQDADPALVVCAWARCDLVKPAHRVLAPEFCCVETWFGSLCAEVTKQRLVVHPVQRGIGRGVEGGLATGGQGQEVTLLPLHKPTVDRRE